eukprot:c40017_g1_i1 orf=303-1274(-)
MAVFSKGVELGIIHFNAQLAHATFRSPDLQRSFHPFHSLPVWPLRHRVILQRPSLGLRSFWWIRRLSFQGSNDFWARSGEYVDDSGTGLAIGVDLKTLRFTFFYIVLDIIKFIFRLPSIISSLFRKEKAIIDEVEEDVDKAAELVKSAATVIKEVAEEVEKICEAVEKDSGEVEAAMDKVKSTAKAMHEELDEALGDLESSVEDVNKSVVKGRSGEANVKVAVKGKAKEAKTTADNKTTTTSTTSSANSNFTTSKCAAVLGNDLWRDLQRKWMKIFTHSVDQKMVWNVMLRAFAMGLAVAVVMELQLKTYGGGLRNQVLSVLM